MNDIKHLLGRSAIVPLINREIPIIADDHGGSRVRHRRGEDHAGTRSE